MMRSLAAAIVALCAVLGHAQANTTLLPNGSQCFSATVGISGMVGTLGTITGGSGYVNGTYGGVSLTGGSGSGATANITVSGGAVTSVTVLSPGKQYVVGDTLSAAAASIGGSGSGFSVPVTSTAINGSLAGGTVAMYVPNTTTPKQTWQDANQTTLNSNPITLDANGCATIYGVGSYRQVLSDSLGNLVWDKVTTDTSASNSVFWAGIAGGTPNVITVTDTGFNGTDGSIINFTAISTNTSSVTLNPSGFGAIPVLQDTTGGPVALLPGQIIQNNPISVIFRASDNAFHLLNPPIQSANGATSPLCGATGLKIVNNTGTPNTIINLTANQAVAQTASGLVINRSNVSLTNINTTLGTTTSAANGMDGEAVGTNTWIYIWLIDNGAAPAGLLSRADVNGLNPTMPSGYTYKCRLGAMRVDGSGNLLRTQQLGPHAQYTTTYPTIASGITGGTAPFPVGNFVPPTATDLFGRACVQANTQSASYGPNTTLSQVFVSTTGTQLQCGAADTVLESTNIGFAGSDATSNVVAMGWKDAVNAN